MNEYRQTEEHLEDIRRQCNTKRWKTMPDVWAVYGGLVPLSNEGSAKLDVYKRVGYGTLLVAL